MNKSTIDGVGVRIHETLALLVITAAAGPVVWGVGNWLSSTVGKASPIGI